MIILTEEQAQQIEDALVATLKNNDYWLEKCTGALDTIREALAEQAERVTEGNGSEVSLETEAQEPVAWVDAKEEGYEFHGLRELPAGKHHLYAAPVRTKDLTDVDLWNLWEKSDSNIDFARAVIAADREKNK